MTLRAIRTKVEKTQMLGLLKIYSLIGYAVHKYPRNSSARAWAARVAVENAYRNGLIDCKPEWITARKAQVTIGGEKNIVDLEQMII